LIRDLPLTAVAINNQGAPGNRRTQECDMNFLARSFLAIGIFICFIGATKADTPSLSLTADGLGPFIIGMSLAEANQHLREKVVPHEVSTRATPNCDYNEIPELRGVAFVFIDKRLMRIDVTTPDWKYDGAIVVGMDKDTFLHRVKHALPEPLDHVPEGLSYVAESRSSRHAVSFQFEGDRLSRMIAGDKKIIRYAEGCM
jgi:hypothetical protein